MVTNYPQQLSNTTQVAQDHASETSFVGRLASRVGQVICGLHGHDSVLHFESNRVMMRCTSCGHDTPGWEIWARVRACATKATRIGTCSTRSPGLYRARVRSARRQRRA